MIDFISDIFDRYSAAAAAYRGDWAGAIERMTPITFLRDALGYTQYQNTKASTQAQNEYENYLRRGYDRQYEDWLKNVGRYGRTIRYPELSYPGYSARASTSMYRNMLSYSTAGANFYGNLPYRGAGLYGIASSMSRYL